MASILNPESSTGLQLGNGSSLIDPVFHLPEISKPTRTSDFTIYPPSIKIDPLVRKLVETESERLRNKATKDSSNEVDWRLYTILETSDAGKDHMKVRLTRESKSAVVSEVSKAINQSSIDHASKYLLSNESLYAYALSYAIYYEKVSDAEGINDRILVATEKEIKSYFNMLLAEKVIAERHLKLSREQARLIRETAATTPISYLAGQPIKAINKIISKYVDYGNLNDLVEQFFASGQIDPQKGTPEVKQLMVKYLVDIGLRVVDDPKDEELKKEGNPADKPVASGTERPAPASGLSERSKALK